MAGAGIRDASSVVLIRDRESNPKVLMGQRGTKAAFMPSKFVFPGGAVDPGDRTAELSGRPSRACMDRLAARSDPALVDPLLLCAVREVWEEAGIRLARKHSTASPPASRDSSWLAFGAGAWAPSAEGLVYFFRAITPPGRTRRFDARFFLGDLNRVRIVGSPDDFSEATDELANLQWATFDDAEKLDLPSISRRVLSAAKRLLRADEPPTGVPFHYTEDGKRCLETL